MVMTNVNHIERMCIIGWLLATRAQWCESMLPWWLAYWRLLTAHTPLSQHSCNEFTDCQWEDHMVKVRTGQLPSSYAEAVKTEVANTSYTG